MISSPFTIVVDSAEQNPWSFRGIRSDSKDEDQKIHAKTVVRSLGRHPNSKGDYSIDGYVDKVAIERKSVEDVIGTVLGFNDDRRKRFESELYNLAAGISVIMVEGPIEQCIRQCGDYGEKSARHQRKIFNRSILAYMQDFSVAWMFCGDRRHAEVNCYRWLYRYWWHNIKNKEIEQSKLF